MVFDYIQTCFRFFSFNTIHGINANDCVPLIISNISNSECRTDAEAVAALIEERFPGTKGKIHISSIGSTIGAHTGPGTVATFFWGKSGEDEK